MHIHQVASLWRRSIPAPSRIPSIFSTESKHYPAPPSSSTSYLVPSVPSPGFCSFELPPTQPSATLSRELRNLVAGQHFHRAGTKGRTTKRRETSENFVPPGSPEFTRLPTASEFSGARRGNFEGNVANDRTFFRGPSICRIAFLS